MSAVGTPGYRSPEQQAIVNNNFHGISIPENSWFCDNSKHDKFTEHAVNPHGIHENRCDGTCFYEGDQKYICCGKTHCLYCDTPMHGCTENEFIVTENNTIIRAHRHCYLKHNKN